MVVAHPDDESLWAGGLLARYPGKWLVICCTIPARDSERIDCFMRACETLDAKPHLLEHPERGGRIPLDKLNLSDRDLVVTHGPNGEYGHPQHRECFEVLSKRYPLVHFAYGDTPAFTLELTDFEWERKLAALRRYNNYSSADNGKVKWQALLDYYGTRYDLRREPYGLSDPGQDGRQAADNPGS